MILSRLPAISKAALNGYRFSRRAWKDTEYLRIMQEKALRKAVWTAYHETDFFNKKYKKHGVRPQDIQTLQDLPKLPIITKKELVEHFEQAVPKSLNKKNAFLLETSGSTGQPVQVYKDYMWIAHGFGFGLQMLKLHKMGLPKAAFVLDIDSISSIENTAGRYLKFFTKKALIFSVEQDVRHIMEQLESADIRYIATYTGFMRELAFLKKNGMGKKLRLKKIGLTGEILDDYTRKYIEDAFECPCFSSYVSTEAGPIAIECEYKKMHINSDLLAVEIVDDEGKPLPAGKDGNIVLTSHDGGYGTPIIRYSGCSDIGQILEESCRCGMHTPIMGPIKGRTVDVIRLPDGRIFHAFAMTIPMLQIQRQYGDDLIRQYQIVQHQLDQVTINLILSKEKARSNGIFTELMETIRKVYSKKLGDEVLLNVVEVEKLICSTNQGMPNSLVVSNIVEKDGSFLRE